VPNSIANVNVVAQKPGATVQGGVADPRAECRRARLTLRLNGQNEFSMTRNQDAERETPQVTVTLAKIVANAIALRTFSYKVESESSDLKSVL